MSWKASAELRCSCRGEVCPHGIDQAEPDSIRGRDVILAFLQRAAQGKEKQPELQEIVRLYVRVGGSMFGPDPVADFSDVDLKAM